MNEQRYDPANPPKRARCLLVQISRALPACDLWLRWSDFDRHLDVVILEPNMGWYFVITAFSRRGSMDRLLSTAEIARVRVVLGHDFKK